MNEGRPRAGHGLGEGGWLETAVYDRYALPRGAPLAGPAVFEEDESTFVIGPGARARVLPDGSILAESPAARPRSA